MDKIFILLSDYFANLDLEWLANYDTLGVELKMNFNVGSDKFIGFIDLLLRDRDSKIVIIDHKSTEYPFKIDGTVKKNSLKSFESYKRQMYLYCHSIYQKYGEFPDRIVWNHFKDGGKFAAIPFVYEEYLQTIKWFETTIKKIKREKKFNPNQDFFYCSQLCNFRASCEYRKGASRK